MDTYKLLKFSTYKWEHIQKPWKSFFFNEKVEL